MTGRGPESTWPREKETQRRDSTRDKSLLLPDGAPHKDVR